MQELSKQITITEDGQRKRITKLQAFMMQLVNKGISGEPAATRTMSRYIERLQFGLDAVAAHQPVERPKVSPRDYTNEELRAIIAAGTKEAEQ